MFNFWIYTSSMLLVIFIELYCIIVYCVVCIFYCIALHYCIVLYSIALHCIVLYCFVLYFIVAYCIGLYCIVYTVMYCIIIAMYCIAFLYNVPVFSIIIITFILMTNTKIRGAVLRGLTQIQVLLIQHYDELNIHVVFVHYSIDFSYSINSSDAIGNFMEQNTINNYVH